jgi:hypothetical protein
MSKLTHLKLILSGSTIEAYNYQQRGILYGYRVSRNHTHRARIVVVDEKTRLRKLACRKASMHRSGSQLRRLVNMNAWNWLKPCGKPYLPTFVTFTFAEDIRDIPTANRIFSNFIKRLNYFINDGKSSFLKYTVVTEFQDFSRDGVIHYHAVFFNLKHIWKDTLYEIWDQGFVNIKAIQHVDNIGAYISKYMVKHFEDDRLDGKKRYFSSRGLLKPIVVKNEEKALAIVRRIPAKYIVKEKEFESTYHGKGKYRQYKLGKKQSLIDIVPELLELL